MSHGDRWREADRWLDQALELPVEKRTAFLEECPDAELRVRVRKLLELAEDTEGGLVPGALSIDWQDPDDEDGFEPGSMLSGRYRLDQKIGQGGMGAVFRARDTMLGRDVAVKVISGPGIDAHSRERLFREARAAAALNHPNIASIYDVGEEDGRPFLVMELVEGPTLASSPPRTLAEIVDAARQICAALEHAHARGIVHRDLKPGNVLVAETESGPTLKIVDLGVALGRGDTRVTAEGRILGTPSYMAPEQATGGDVDGRCDLYALGVMLYHWTTERLPFVGDDALSVVSQHIHAAPAPPRTLAPDLPEPIEAAILRLLAKDPRDRFADAGRLIEELAAAVQRAASPFLEIRLLGGTELFSRSLSLSTRDWRRRPGELLRLVAMQPNGALRRDEVTEVLWPDKDESSAAGNLHRALHDLRKLLGGKWVVLEKGLVRLVDGVRVDVRDFEAAAAGKDSAAWQRAVDLYRGDLCPENTNLDWLEPRRVALRQRFIEVALRLARHATTVAEDAVAIGCLLKVLEAEPAQEEAHRLLMRAYAASGRTQDALRQYERCRLALAEHAGAEPAPETGALLEEIRKREKPRGSLAPWQRVCRRVIGASRPPAMFGREREREIIESIVRQLVESREAEGAGAVLLMGGEAGTGKSRLVAEVVEAAGRAGVLVLAGAAHEISSGLPYAPFVEAWTEQAKISGEPSSNNPFTSFAPTSDHMQESTLRLFHAVESAIFRSSGDAPAVLVIEDLHWADESSLQLFHELQRRAANRPLLLVGTYVEEEVRGSRGRTTLGSLLSNSRRQRVVHWIRLGPLGPEETAAQIEALTGAPTDPAFARQVHELSGGNPLFAEELVLNSLERGARDGSLEIPESLAQVVEERVRRLGEDAASFLRVASVAGRAFRFDWVREASGLSEGRALDALESSLRAGVLGDDGEGWYRFRHALVREAIYGELSRERRKSLHGLLAEAILEVEPEDPASGRDAILAHHFESAGRPLEALPHFTAAGRFAMTRVGFQEARTSFEKALAILDAQGEVAGLRRFRLLRSLGAIHLSLSSLDDAVRYFEAAASLPPSDDGWAPGAEDRAGVLRGAALALITAGDLARADALLADVLSALPQGSSQLSSVLYHLAQLRWSEGRYADAYAAAERVVTEAEKTNDTEALAKGYEMLALSCHSLGEWREGVEFVEKRKKIVGDAVDVAEAFDAHL